MPKTRRKLSKIDNKSRSVQIAFKLSGRKSEKSALRMSTEDLIDAYNSKATRKKDLNKIKTVLLNRNYDFETENFELISEETVDNNAPVAQ